MTGRYEIVWGASFTCHSPAVNAALHVLSCLKLPSVALYVVELTFRGGFDSHLPPQISNQLAGNKSQQITWSSPVPSGPPSPEHAIVFAEIWRANPHQRKSHASLCITGAQSVSVDISWN